MNKGENLMQFEDSDDVLHIRKQLSEELNKKVNDDQINLIVDLIYDYYDSEGLLADGVDESKVVEINDIDIINYVFAALEKEKDFPLSFEETQMIVKGELNYCESIGLFE